MDVARGRTLQNVFEEDLSVYLGENCFVAFMHQLGRVRIPDIQKKWRCFGNNPLAFWCKSLEKLA